jgi:hypothetical protein
MRASRRAEKARRPSAAGAGGVGVCGAAAQARVRAGAGACRLRLRCLRERVPAEARERLADDGRNDGPRYSSRRPPADALGLGLTSFAGVASLARLDRLFRESVTYLFRVFQFIAVGNRIDILFFCPSPHL